MKAFIIFLLLGLLLGIMLPLSFAQRSQDTQKLDPEIETLKERISALQNQLQTVENEKIELTVKLLDTQAKLADANARLINTEFGKLERGLRDSNQKWLVGWIVFFLAVLAVVGTPLWLLLKSGVNRIITDLKSNADQLISDEVERSLTGFKKAVEQVNILQDQIRILEKEHAVSVLAHSVHLFYHSETDSEQIKPIPDRALLDLLADKTRDLSFRYKAMEILVVRESTAVVSVLPSEIRATP